MGALKNHALEAPHTYVQALECNHVRELLRVALKESKKDSYVGTHYAAAWVERARSNAIRGDVCIMLPVVERVSRIIFARVLGLEYNHG